MALLIAEQMERRGAERNDSALLLVGHKHHAESSFFLGEFILARAHFEQSRGLQRNLDPALYEKLYTFGGINRFRGDLLINHAVTLAHLGYIDQARSCVDEAASEARGFEHSYYAATVSVYAAWVECVASSPHAVRRYAEQAIALASDFPAWLEGADSIQ